MEQNPNDTSRLLGRNNRTERPVRDARFSKEEKGDKKKRTEEDWLEIIKKLPSKKEKAAQSEKPIWKSYRRNYKGHFKPKRTRANCLRTRNPKHWHGNWCPLCLIQTRQYPSVTYKDVKILKQFICPHSGQTLTTYVTGLCIRQQKVLLAAIAKAKDYGYLYETLIPPSAEDLTGLAKQHTPAGIPNDRHLRMSGMGKRARQTLRRKGVYRNTIF